jgi:hypothetical protein
MAAVAAPGHRSRQWPEAPPATGGYLAAQAGILREMKRRRTAVADPAGSVAG